MLRKILLSVTVLSFAACLEPQAPLYVKDTPSSDFQIETVSDSLIKPWGVAALPGGGYLVTEIAGHVKLIQKGKTITVTGLPTDILVEGQGGLMGIVLGPDFETSGELYLSYAYGSKDNNGTAIYKARLEGNELIEGSVIFKSGAGKAGGSHFGGRMVFLPDETLVLTLGDGFSYREHAQKLDTHLGKIVRLNSDGSAASGNPFTGDDEKLEIHSYGHRNVQGLAYDSETGNLWAHEHGPRGGDELNLIKAGANYGWPLATTGTDYNGARITPHTTFEGTEPFVYDWVPSIAPSGLTIYRGDKFPDWNGDALIGALAGKSVWRIDLDGTKAVGETRLLADLDARVRDVKTDRDGALLVLTETKDGGRLIRLLPKN